MQVAQYVAGYLGSSVERRGKNAEHEAVFSLVELQDLLDEWIVTGWQNRPHGGLRDPLSPGQVLTPNEKYAAMLGVAGYVPVPLSGDDYIELLPMKPPVQLVIAAPTSNSVPNGSVMFATRP